MRLAAQAKCGFYPAPTEAVAMAIGCLRPPVDDPCAVLDPCCGRGDALKQIAQSLHAHAYGIELDEVRSEAAAQNLAEIDGTFVGPASFLGTGIQPNGGVFGFCWLNPPFDDEIGGGRRVEHTFLLRATYWLQTNGVLALVCPERVANIWDMQKHLLEWYTDLSLIPFPKDHRPYNEVIIFGIKRSRPVEWYSQDWGKVSRTPLIYRLPTTYGPRSFEKTDFTEQELSIQLARSPLRRVLESPTPLPIPRPPLPLATGHIALLLAAGHLDGVVHPEGEPPHVVRGTARKEKYVASVEESENGRGGSVTKTIVSEKIVMTVRAVTPDGTIHTFDQE